MGLYWTARVTGEEGEGADSRLRLPDSMLSEDDSPGLRLAMAAGYTPLEGVKGREVAATQAPPDHL